MNAEPQSAAPAPVDERHPWLGLDSFSEDTRGFFYGRDEDGAKTQLIQHVSQLSVTLRAVPKLAEEEPPRRIGFHLTPGWIGGDSGDGSAG